VDLGGGGVTKVFGFCNILIMSLLWKEVCTMVHIVPRIIMGGHGFHDIIIIMKYGRTLGGRETT